MVPTIAANGTSFKGAAAYYLHDKEADTKERIAWTHTENLLTNDPEKAWKVMAWTASQQAMIKATGGTRGTGRKLEKPVFAFSVSWHPEQKPDKAHMLETAKAAAAVLGLEGYQAIYVCHQDEPQKHVHALVNRIYPDTGKAATLSRSKTRLAAWALEYQNQHGESYCPARATNARLRAERKPERERNPVIQAAWRQSDSGRSFSAALTAKGYTLTQGNRRLVVVDSYGKVLNPVRQLPDVRAAAFKAKLAHLDFAALPTAAAVQKRLKQEQRKEYAINRKFEKWSAEYLNKNQDRQIDERAALNARYAKTLADRKDELAEYYKLAQLQERIEALRERVARPSVIRRLTGAVGKDRTELFDQQRQIRDAERRMVENLGAVTTERDFAVADLAERHTRENEMARAYIAERKSAACREEEISTRERASRGGNRNRDEDGDRERVYYRRPPEASPGI